MVLYAFQLEIYRFHTVPSATHQQVVRSWSPTALQLPDIFDRGSRLQPRRDNGCAQATEARRTRLCAIYALVERRGKGSSRKSYDRRRLVPGIFASMPRQRMSWDDMM